MTEGNGEDDRRKDDTGLIRVVLKPVVAPPSLRLPLRAWAQGATVGASVAGPLSAYAFHREIPRETFDWIITNGFQGFLLVSLFVVGSAYLWSIRDRLKFETERREEAKELLRERLDLVESVARSKERTTSILERVASFLEKHDKPECDPRGEPGAKK